MATLNRYGGTTRCATEAATGAGTASSSEMDTDLNTIVNGVNARVSKDGTDAMTGDLDLGGYKITNYGNQASSPTGNLAERHDKESFDPVFGDELGTNCGLGEIQTNTCHYQIIGDVVFYTLRLKTAGTTSTVLSDTLSIVFNNTFSTFDNTGAETLYYPCQIIKASGWGAASVTPATGYLYKNTTTGKPNIAFLNSSGSSIDLYSALPTNAELWATGWFLLDNGSLTIPDT